MIIKVRVLPASRKNEIVTRIGSVLRVQLVTKDVDSEETNKVLKKVVAEFFEVKEKEVFLCQILIPFIETCCDLLIELFQIQLNSKILMMCFFMVMLTPREGLGPKKRFNRGG